MVGSSDRDDGLKSGEVSRISSKVGAEAAAEESAVNPGLRFLLALRMYLSSLGCSKAAFIVATVIILAGAFSIILRSVPLSSGASLLFE